MFLDTAEIEVISGKGGDGCVSFRREKYVPKGGPDGGDGGNGGSVILRADENLGTLMDISSRRRYVAEDGRPGSGSKSTGRSGDDVVIHVPVGTIVYDGEIGNVLRDLNRHDDQVVVARGGRGGKGNTRFKTSTHQTPHEYEEGTPGESRKLRLELKLLADIGLIGLPNAGKSTLLSRLSKAHPKIASYPFTTLVPQLGIAELVRSRYAVIADIPGLIEGAHDGHGLGHEFLRHIERTRILVHLVEMVPTAGQDDPVTAYHTINRGLAEYSPVLRDKPQVVVATKLDIPEARDAMDEFFEAIDQPKLAISAVTGEGLDTLRHTLMRMLEQE